MPKHLYLDIETYSPINLPKSGLYKYAQSADFEILLLAYSYDGGEVQVHDLTENPNLPPELCAALFDTDTIKHAYNAAFEWYCLARHFELDAGQTAAWLPQWRCTMLHGTYCGYPAGLALAGAAVGLPADRQKAKTGGALIRYFCVPCAPKQTNGQRTRNLPKHHPERWGDFKRYNAQDVVTEMEIGRRLQNYPVPEFIQRQWETDQQINLRGVPVDLVFVAAAITCGGEVKQRLMDEAAELTGLANPNSRAQLMPWLERALETELADMRKDTVTALLERELSSDSARRVLEIRQELSKTSLTKYDALQTVMCEDGRVRGLLQFYGANRTGRWAGRLIQPQNLPRTYLAPLPLARDLVKAGRTDILQTLYGAVPDALSQLIRTALAAEPGRTFIDVDFSSIEARIIAWLAGEQWVLDVFNSHGKIYEAAAAQMFGLPLERIAKGNPEYAYRQKGKTATLALGYQGGANALIQQGALKQGLTEEELPEIVSRWREANPNIVRYWYDVERAAIDTVNTGQPHQVGRVRFVRTLDPEREQDFLTIMLPSGRKLFYPKPSTLPGKFGTPGLRFWGANQSTGKWEFTETYGGKLVNNIVQGTARDCLAEALERLRIAGYSTVFHVHDEVVIEVPEAGADAALADVIDIISEIPRWAGGLPLAADGWVNNFYKKD